MVKRSGKAICFSTAVKRQGSTRAVEMLREYNDAIDTIEKLVHDDGIDCDYRRFGAPAGLPRVPLRRCFQQGAAGSGEGVVEGSDAGFMSKAVGVCPPR